MRAPPIGFGWLLFVLVSGSLAGAFGGEPAMSPQAASDGAAQPATAPVDPAKPALRTYDFTATLPDFVGNPIPQDAACLKAEKPADCVPLTLSDVAVTALTKLLPGDMPQQMQMQPAVEASPKQLTQNVARAQLATRISGNSSAALTDKERVYLAKRIKAAFPGGIVALRAVQKLDPTDTDLTASVEP